MKNSIHLKLTLYITVSFILSLALYISFPWLIVPTVVIMGIYIGTRLPGGRLAEETTKTRAAS